MFAQGASLLDRVRQEPLYAAYKRRTVELLDAQPGRRYLEVGTGTGTDALACAERFNVSVVGADSSSVMIEEAVRRGLCEALVTDAHALPFASAGPSFRTVACDRTQVVCSRFRPSGRDDQADEAARPVVAIRRRLGHAKIAPTIGLYARHEIETAERAAADTVAALLDGWR